MNELFKAILENKEAATLPYLKESGQLPALISGLSAVHRANLAAALYKGKMFVICSDDTTAENFAKDLSNMLGRDDINVLPMREISEFKAETASHKEEQIRISALYNIDKSSITVASINGLIQKSISRKELEKNSFSMSMGDIIEIEELEKRLINCGYARCIQVEGCGQFAKRGGIIDIYSPSYQDPVRIEFFGDEIDSMGMFDVLSQRRKDAIDYCLILPTQEDLFEEFATAAEYIPEDASIFFDQPTRCYENANNYTKTLGKQYYIDVDKISLESHDIYMAEAFLTGRNPIEPKYLTSISAKQLPSYAGNIQLAAEDAKALLNNGYSVVILSADDRRAEILKTYLNDHDINAQIGEGIPENGKCKIQIGSISAGMEYPSIKLAILTDGQLIKNKERHYKRKLPKGRERIATYSDLSVGDYVVHEAHGIGRFIGIVKMDVDGYKKDYIKIAYAGSDVLYVPATQLDLVTKYTGYKEEEKVRLSKMGGVEWEKRRSRAKGAAKEMAKKLLNLYAQRLKTDGYAFAPDNEWQKEFEDNFGYSETDDQLRCIAEIKKDMEASVPMDRLLCGDVGFGKTEVAMRAVMKCVLDGKQAAILAPTTVLAQQHYQTALQRFFGFPVNISVLSRFTTGAKVSETLKDIENGKCDLLIGTHRILSKDIKFKNLGLLVVDEEQRFGVTHKEHIKELSKGVDVLTLSATPIPRTMNMAMSGIRDMSMIEEPPENRQPVSTYVLEHNWDIITEAITKELNRGGQVYYLHNRIEDIEKCAKKLQEMLGENVSIAVGHGKMDKRNLAEIMEDMAMGEIQILVCTTIIETGIDIPNVNTLIIEDADKLGLAQLHQIRGRVGRSSRKASAYLTFKKDKVLTEDAEKRLNAVRDFVEFGSGFKIALRDLEIRGAGNLLGAEQSGHMCDVGYDMYMKLLNEAVLEAKGIEVPQKADCSADLAVNASIPEKYIESSEQRMDIYRVIASIRDEEEANDLIDELIDRFGDPPTSVLVLIKIALLRGEAGVAGITEITQKHGDLRYIVKEFDMEKVSTLYSTEKYRKRLKVEAGNKPCVSVKINDKSNVIEEAREFIRDWNGDKNEG